MKKLLLIICVLAFAAPVMAQQTMKLGGGEININRNGEIRVKPRLDKGTTVIGKLNACVDAGSTDAYACSPTPALSSYITGQVFWVKAATANTGAASLNLSALGARTIKKAAGGVTTDLATNDLRANQWFEVLYDGTNFQMLSAAGSVDGGGSVTSVSGTTNQINVATGTSTPALSLSSTLVAPGTVGVTTSLTVGSGTAITRIAYYTATLSPAEVGANTCVEQTFAVTGVTAGDVVFVNKPTAQAGLGIAGVRASAADQVGINFCNVTAAPITPTASQAYVFGVIR